MWEYVTAVCGVSVTEAKRGPGESITTLEENLGLQSSQRAPFSGETLSCIPELFYQILQGETNKHPDSEQDN